VSARTKFALSLQTTGKAVALISVAGVAPATKVVLPSAPRHCRNINNSVYAYVNYAYTAVCQVKQAPLCLREHPALLPWWGGILTCLNRASQGAGAAWGSSMSQPAHVPGLAWAASACPRRAESWQKTACAWGAELRLGSFVCRSTLWRLPRPQCCGRCVNLAFCSAVGVKRLNSHQHFHYLNKITSGLLRSVAEK